MRNFLFEARLFIGIVGLSAATYAAGADELSRSGTQIHKNDPSISLKDLTEGDPFFYTSDQNIVPGDKLEKVLGAGRPNKTHSLIPHLPIYFGYMNTNSTYRFVNVVEQVFTMIGEGKHGLWRAQESGYIREYLKKGAIGLARGSDLMAPENLKTIEEAYRAFLPEESWAGYKYPDQQFAADGAMNFIDLSITHPKYLDKYREHVPIDLPTWYCTMSEDGYPYAELAMNFSFAQEGANVIGPLGKRAGLDIKENYSNVLRVNQFPDARAWVNVGQKGKDNLHVQWEAINSQKMAAEFYVVERPFFNRPYLFTIAIFDNPDNKDFRYLRPEGTYFDSVKSYPAVVRSSSKVTLQPRFWLTNGRMAEAIGLPVYGVHHPNRAAFDAGGACPLKGGDWGRYPDVAGGSGWPTQYEEVTPLCDAVLIDIKFYANLDGRDWSDKSKYLANAGKGTKAVTYTMQPGKYGVFSDLYNVKRGAVNKEALAVPSTLDLTFPGVSAPVGYVNPPAKLNRGAAAAGPVPSVVSTCRPVITANSSSK